MSIPLLIPWMFVKMLLLVDSAPKIGNALYDPLTFDVSDSFLSDESIIPNLRRDVSPDEPPSIQLGGYIYDVNKCKHINGRTLCGYDRNRGTLKDESLFVDNGDGCRTRGDRIECGYDTKPYNRVLRHPSVKSGRSEKNGSTIQHDLMVRQAPTRTTTPETYPLDIEDDFLENTLSSEVVEQIKSSTLTSVIPDKTEFTANEIPTLSTSLTESTTVTVLIRMSDINIIETTTTSSTPLSSTTTSSTPISSIEITSTSIESTEDISSDSDAMRRIVKLNQNNDYKKGTNERRRRLVDILSTSSNLDTKSNRGSVNTDSPICNSCPKIAMDLNIKRNRNEKVTTACVEKNDRVVCYDFKT